MISDPEKTKPGLGKLSRSVLHQLFTTALPFARAPHVWSEILGGVMVVGLFTLTVVLMRFLLAD